MIIMTSLISPMVTSILALRPELRPASDELKKRVQSIRVRSAQETQTIPGWRQRQSAQTGGSSSHNQNQGKGMNGRWRHSNSNLPNPPSASTPSSPFRFSNTSPAQSPNYTPGLQRTPSFFSTTPLSPVGIPASPTSAPVHSGTPLGSPNATPIATPIATPTTTQIPMRYVSKFHNGAKKGDDQILNTVILNKLNVFSVKTYDDVKQFLFQILGSDQREFVREFTWLVFRKAAAEEKFCGLFAKLLSEIKKEYPVILEEMRNLHTTYLDIWKNQDISEAKVDRRCRQGYSQFLAELTTLEVLESDTMKATIEQLKSCIVECLSCEESKKTIEEYTDCLKQLCNTKTPKHIRQIIREILVSDLETWIAKDSKEVPGLSSKSRFAFMDLRDFLVKSA